MNLQQSDHTELGQKGKDGVKEKEEMLRKEEMMLRKEDRVKEKEFIEEAEHELQKRGGGLGRRRENYGFWQKADGARNGREIFFAKNGRLSRKEHFVRDRHNQNIHSRLGPWMEKSSRHHPYKRSDAKVKAGEGRRSGNSNKKQSFIIVDQVGMLD